MLHQYHGNDMEVLRAVACELLADDPPPPLVAERLIVPNVGMAKWLRQGIAARLGVAANLASESPAVFLNGLASAVLSDADPSAERAWSKERLAIRLMQVLPALAGEAPFAAVSRYLDGVTPQRRLHALSRRLAALLDQYLLYRPDWLLAWETGGNAADCPLAGNEWQAMLWRALVRQISAEHPGSIHGAGRLQALIARLGGGGELAGPLPSRVTGFGMGALPPVFVDALAALAARTEVHLFLFNPCSEYWFDIASERTLARWRLLAPARGALSDTLNPLLASWGTLGRDSLQRLLGRDAGEWQPCFRDVDAPGVLGELQRDILTLGTPGEPRALDPADDSVVFAETHSALREVEALHDHLLELLGTLPDLQPRDITVMAPDISCYAGLIDAVFTAPQHDPRHLPYNIADRSARAGNTLAQSFLHLLKLPESRFTASEVLALLAVPALGAHFGVDAEALDSLRARVRDSGVRWGRDEPAPAQPHRAPARNSWRFGLERMLLGIALEEGAIFEGIAPFETGGQDAIEQTGRLAEFVSRLGRYAETLERARPMGEWITFLQGLVADFYADGPESAAELAEVRTALAALAATLEESGFREPLTREVLIDMLEERLDTLETSHQFLRGGINFCQLTPLRSIPFRVVCLLGMNAETFPRNTLEPAFDLMASRPRAGDPSRREDDRYLFLEALLSARDCFYVSRVARDERSNEAREPALPVNELREYIDRHWRAAGSSAASECLTRAHRLKPFDREYFTGGGRLFSYRREWLPAASAASAATPFCPVALAELALAELTLAELQRFFRNPCQGFFSGRLGIRFDEAEQVAGDCEPLALDALEGWQLRDTMLRSALAGRDTATCAAELIASGILPHGAAGLAALRREAERAAPLIATAKAWAALEPASAELALDIGAVRLSGMLTGIRGAALRLVTASKPNGGTLLQFWIAHLCACAAGVVRAPSQWHGQGQELALALLDAGPAREELRALVRLYAEGMRRPLPLFPQSAWQFAKQLARGNDEDAALRAARKHFAGSEHSRGEAGDAYVARAFPDAEFALGDEFAAFARAVFMPLLAACAGEAP